jgi:uncharacterized protein (TIGR03083 family)
MPAPDYADEYAAGRARIRSLLADCTAEQAATVVPTCPAWDVHDVCAHLAGVSAALVARDSPGADGQAWVDRHVSERAGRSVSELLHEWDAVGPAFEGIMRKVPRAFGGLIYDVIAHEHDIRGALGRPGAQDTDGVWASLDVLVSMVSADLAVHGPVPGTLELHAGDREWTIGTGGPTVSLTASPWELMRLLGSRRSRRQFLAAGWTGDVEAFLPAITHLPLPLVDIVE